MGDQAKYKDEPAPSPPRPALDDISSRLNSHAASMRFVREHITGVLDRAFGAAPQSGATAKPKAVRSGSIGAIEDTFEEISDQIADITNMLARLETLA